MTVLIGLRCQDGAVLACDSQETRGNYFRFWSKVSLVENRFAVLYAGSPTIGEAFTRHLVIAFHELTKANADVPDKHRATRLVDSVLLELARDGGESAVKDRQLLVVGLAGNNEICLWAIDAGEIYAREMRTWECYGSGIDAAEMMLKEFYFPEVTTREAIPLLAYVIGVVSEMCLDCGEPISVMVINSQGIKQLSIQEVNSALARVKGPLEKVRKVLPKRIFKGESVE